MCSWLNVGAMMMETTCGILLAVMENMNIIWMMVEWLFGKALLEEPFLLHNLSDPQALQFFADC
jgi:hypothetical protein